MNIAACREAFKRLADGREMRLMEVCGSHSLAIAKYGIRGLLPDNIKLLSGPGCPVCVSRAGLVTQAQMVLEKGAVLAVFGDLARIPGPGGVRLDMQPGVTAVYSPDEALKIAREKEVVLTAVGFEPTTAAAAAVLLEAQEKNLTGFSMLCDCKNLFPVFPMLPGVDGFLLPGHVAAVTGRAAFDVLDRPGVIAGFEPEEIVLALLHLVKKVAQNDCRAENDYPRIVPENAGTAMRLIEKCFTVCDSLWRGIGPVPQGGRRISDSFAAFDAVKKYDLPDIPEPGTACRCGAVLRGAIMPQECPLFGKACTPEHPAGACMVSTEGACAAAFAHQEI
jgi:hydrogenase expression/formation protein HypD